MSRRAHSNADNSDLFGRANAARIDEARRRLRLARASRGGVKAAERQLKLTVLDVLREELGKK